MFRATQARVRVGALVKRQGRGSKGATTMVYEVTVPGARSHDTGHALALAVARASWPPSVAAAQPKGGLRLAYDKYVRLAWPYSLEHTAFQYCQAVEDLAFTEHDLK